MIQYKRIYDPQEKEDGKRILVDRLWPRGVKKEDVHMDAWLKSITPSNELRKSYHDGEIDYAEFKKRYKSELQRNSDVEALAGEAKKRTITLLTAVKDVEHSHVPVLVEQLKR